MTFNLVSLVCCLLLAQCQKHLLAFINFHFRKKKTPEAEANSPWRRRLKGRGSYEPRIPWAGLKHPCAAHYPLPSKMNNFPFFNMAVLARNSSLSCRKRNAKKDATVWVEWQFFVLLALSTSLCQARGCFLPFFVFWFFLFVVPQAPASAVAG